VLSINVANGMTWKINRPIDVEFSADVDMATVSLNTVRVMDGTGRSATGTFALLVRSTGEIEPRTVRFRPRCPVEEDFSDAGLQPGTTYQLQVLGSNEGGSTVRSTAGEALEQGKLVTFHTPDSDNPLLLFVDQVPGPPQVRLRGAGLPEDEEEATYLELGGERAYFERNEAQEGSLPEGFKVPLNHYSIGENRVSVVVVFNQAVDGSAANLSVDRLRLEYQETGGEWRVLGTELELLSNCTEVGAEVRLSPRGLLPRGSSVRVALKEGFADLTGDALPLDQTSFAKLETGEEGDENPLFAGVGNPRVDEVLDSFDFGGGEQGESWEDAGAAYEVPLADWGGGELRAAFDFGGTGGPDGEFDWHIPPGADIVLDTAGDTIVGGPGGVPTGTQSVVNGVVDVRDVFIPATSRLIVTGPFACTILATGKVTVLGEISVRGSDNLGVNSLNTTFQPEPGAKGQAGGGDGGTGSYLTNQSTPRGGPGDGPFGAKGKGGQGGETSYSSQGIQARHGAGGGGGRLGHDITYDHDLDGGAVTPMVRCQTLVGLDIEHGSRGGKLGLGAESQSERAWGGLPSSGPWSDPSDDNDFFGSMLRADGTIVHGEVDTVWAGSGGGGGGDAVDSDSFPLVPWDPAGDEKGAGGGGGAGGLRVLAIGPIQIGDEEHPGRIAADGGDGGGGEDSAYRIGGGSGGGSGGHVVLSSAAEIVVYGKTDSALPWYHDDPEEIVHDGRPFSALGGQGGAGNFNKGGATEDGPRPWSCDNVPFEYFEGIPDVPPQENVCFLNQSDYQDKEGGPSVGAGGDGGPGIIQLHVEDPSTRLRFPTLEAEQGLTYGTGLDVTPTCAPPPLGWHEPGGAIDALVPFFGRLSRARSKWIPLGLARVNPDGSDGQVLLRFEGLDGGVPHEGGSVAQLPEILGPEALGASGVPPYIGAGGGSVVFDASGLGEEDEVLLENPALLRSFTVELSDSGDESNYQRYRIAWAKVQEGTGWLECGVEGEGPSPLDFVATGEARAALRPHYFRVTTDGVADAYPETSQVTIRFDATKTDGVTGEPSETEKYSEGAGGLTEDVRALNADTWDWLRFEVEFDLDTQGDGVTLNTPRPGLEHLRLPFRF